MSVGIRNVTTTAFANRENTDITKPTGTASGDVLVALFFNGNTGTAQAISAPDGSWTEATSPGSYTDGANWQGVWHIFWKVAGGSEPDTYTFWHYYTNTEVILYALTGANTTTPIAPTATFYQGTGTTATSPSITTTVDNSLIIDWTMAWWDGSSPTAPTGTTPTFTPRFTGTAYVADGVLATHGATGDKSTGFPNNGTHETIGILVAVEAATTGVTIIVPAIDVAVAGLTPTIASGGSVTVPAINVAVAGLTPTVASGGSVTVPAINVAVAGLTPTIASGGSVTVPAINVGITTQIPDIFKGIIVYATTIDIAVAGKVPNIAGLITGAGVLTGSAVVEASGENATPIVSSWDENNKASSITLSNEYLTAEGSGCVFGTTGVLANTEDDYSFVLNIDDQGSNSSSAVSIRNVSTVGYGARTDTTFNKPTNTTNGDILVALIEIDSYAPAPSITPPDSSWTQVTPSDLYIYTDSSYWQGAWRIFWKLAGNSEQSSYTFSHSWAHSEGILYALIGADPNAPISVTPTWNVTNGTNVTALSVTPPVTNSFLIDWVTGWASDVSAVGATTPSGSTPTFTSRYVGSVNAFFDGSLTTADPCGNKTSTLPANTNADNIAILILVNGEQSVNEYCIGLNSLSTDVRPPNYSGTNPEAIKILNTNGNFVDNTNNLIIKVSDGVPIGTGDQLEFRIKNGKLYLRRKPNGGSWQTWNGTYGIYGYADPTTDTNGFPLTAFGSNQLFPLLYLETATVTANFDNWVSSSPIVNSGSGVVSATSVINGRSGSIVSIAGTSIVAGSGTYSSETEEWYSVITATATVAGRSTTSNPPLGLLLLYEDVISEIRSSAGLVTTNTTVIGAGTRILEAYGVATGSAVVTGAPQYISGSYGEVTCTSFVMGHGEETSVVVGENFFPTALKLKFEESVFTIFFAVRIAFPLYTMRVLDSVSAGIYINGEFYTGSDPELGSLISFDVVSDGVGDDAPSVRIVMLPPDPLTTYKFLLPTDQGAQVQIFVGAVEPVMGQLVGYQEIFLGEVDTQTLEVDTNLRQVTLECVSVFERFFADDEGTRLTDSWHEWVWPGEQGLIYITDIERQIPWGADAPLTPPVRATTTPYIGR